MNKKYMDFVPKTKQVPVKKPVEVKKPVAIKEEPEVKIEQEIVLDEFFAVDNNPKSQAEDFDFGIIEDYDPKAEKKAEKEEKKSTEKPAKAPTGATLNVPKTRFVNTDKIEKRPLSKNVYKKNVTPLKEEKTGPVTIIAKQDKGSHIGVIITIILTIVLGAAAGTVAFLLLPK